MISLPKKILPKKIVCQKSNTIKVRERTKKHLKIWECVEIQGSTRKTKSRGFILQIMKFVKFIYIYVFDNI